MTMEFPILSHLVIYSYNLGRRSTEQGRRDIGPAIGTILASGDLLLSLFVFSVRSPIQSRVSSNWMRYANN
jgi:hypothetical protein